METKVDCFIAVNENPATYAGVDCSLLVDDNESGAFFGVRIPCELDGVSRDTVDACVNTSQGIRVTITVNGEDVSDALVGSIQIMHNLNYISTFSFSLGDPKYSPKVDANIDIGHIVIITVYINGQEMRLFTGIIDGIPATNKEKYRIDIFGRDYGKKLKTTKTLISIQEAAQRKYRGSMVKYLAGQVGITGVNIPLGDAVTIDHSFQDQEVWDMVQKECEIEGWYVRFDEYSIMYVKTKVLKTTPDWEYGENKFIEIGLNKEYDCIINKVIILGAIFEEETITQDETDQEVEPAEDPEDTYTDYSFSHSFAAGEVVEGWSEGDAVIKVTASYIGYTKPLGYIFPTTQNYKFTISGSDSGKIKGLAFSITGGAFGSKGSNYVTVYRDCTGVLPSFSQAAFAITITFKVKDEGSAIEDLETENPEATFTSTITYTQVKANVSDPNSIGIYGERKPKNGISMDFPLAETVAQCKRIGENVIIDSHRFVEQPDIEVPYNPKLTVGQTIRLTDKKHGYDEDDYLIEEVIHYIIYDDDGKIKARTRVGGVFYS